MKKGSSAVACTILIMATLGLGGCQPDHSGDAQPSRRIEICMQGTAEKSACKDLLTLDVKVRAPLLPKASYLASGTQMDFFQISLPTFPGIPDYHKDGRYDVHISLGYETPQERFKRYMAIPELPSDQEVGSLVVVKESARGEKGTALLAPKDGNRSILFFCTKPYRATAGNLVTNPGCSVWAELQRYVYIQYPIGYASLPAWQEIHQHVIDQIANAMSITRTLTP